MRCGVTCPITLRVGICQDCHTTFSFGGRLSSVDQATAPILMAGSRVNQNRKQHVEDELERFQMEKSYIFSATNGYEY